jgi:hypothetical protein
MAAIWIAGSVAGAKRLCQVIDGKFNQLHKRWLVVAALVGKGAQDVCYDTIDALHLACGVVVTMW